MCISNYIYVIMKGLDYKSLNTSLEELTLIRNSFSRHLHCYMKTMEQLVRAFLLSFSKFEFIFSVLCNDPLFCFELKFILFSDHRHLNTFLGLLTFHNSFVFFQGFYGSHSLHLYLVESVKRYLWTLHLL